MMCTQLGLIESRLRATFAGDIVAGRLISLTSTREAEMFRPSPLKVHPSTEPPATSTDVAAATNPTLLQTELSSPTRATHLALQTPAIATSVALSVSTSSAFTHMRRTSTRDDSCSPAAATATAAAPPPPPSLPPPSGAVALSAATFPFMDQATADYYARLRASRAAKARNKRQTKAAAKQAYAAAAPQRAAAAQQQAAFAAQQATNLVVAQVAPSPPPSPPPPPLAPAPPREDLYAFLSAPTASHPPPPPRLTTIPPRRPAAEATAASAQRLRPLEVATRDCVVLQPPRTTRSRELLVSNLTPPVCPFVACYNEKELIVRNVTLVLSCEPQAKLTTEQARLRHSIGTHNDSHQVQLDRETVQGLWLDLHLLNRRSRRVTQEPDDLFSALGVAMEIDPHLLRAGVVAMCRDGPRYPLPHLRNPSGSERVPTLMDAFQCLNVESYHEFVCSLSDPTVSLGTISLALANVAARLLKVNIAVADMSDNETLDWPIISCGERIWDPEAANPATALLFLADGHFTGTEATPASRYPSFGRQQFFEFATHVLTVPRPPNEQWGACKLLSCHRTCTYRPILVSDAAVMLNSQEEIPLAVLQAVLAQGWQMSFIKVQHLARSMHGSNCSGMGDIFILPPLEIDGPRIDYVKFLQYWVSSNAHGQMETGQVAVVIPLLDVRTGIVTTVRLSAQQVCVSYGHDDPQATSVQTIVAELMGAWESRILPDMWRTLHRKGEKLSHRQRERWQAIIAQRPPPLTLDYTGYSDKIDTPLQTIKGMAVYYAEVTTARRSDPCPRPVLVRVIMLESDKRNNLSCGLIESMYLRTYLGVLESLCINHAMQREMTAQGVRNKLLLDLVAGRQLPFPMDSFN